MIKNQSAQPSPAQPKRMAIASVILGIVNLLGGLARFLHGEIGAYLFDYYSWQYQVYFSIFIPLAIIGLILGIISQKSSKKLGKIGIVLSAVALLILLFWYFLYLGFSHMQ